MTLNCSEINLILKEAKLEGSFIQKVLQTSYTTLVLGLYKDKAFNLFFSLEASSCRLNISKKNFSKTKKPLRFMELLRSRIIGLKISSAEQINANRIVKFCLKNVKTGEEFFLYARFWSAAANIILCDNNNKIIDAFYRRPNRKEISGEYFMEEKLSPIAEVNKTLAQFPVREYEALSFNDYIDTVYQDENPVINVESLQKEIVFTYARKIAKLKQSLKAIEKKRMKLKDPEKLRLAGDLLLSNISSLKNAAPCDVFEASDYHTGEIVKIKLDPRKSPQENASDYYSQAKKIASGTRALNENIESITKQLAELENLSEIAKNETNIKQLKKILEKQNVSTLTKLTKNRVEKSFSGIKFNLDGFLVFVGRNANENDELLRHCVRGSDLWMHVRDYAGSYVFIKAKNKKTFPLEVLLAAANLAVFYSKAKKAGEASVYYTAVKNLRRAKNAKKGTVLPQREKTIFIKLDKKILEKNELGRIIDE